MSVNNNGVRKVCREVFFAGACAGACAGANFHANYIIPNIGKETRREQRGATTTHTMPRKKPTERNAISRAMKAVQTQAMKIVGSPSPKGRVRKIELEFDRLNNSHIARTLNTGRGLYVRREVTLTLFSRCDLAHAFSSLDSSLAFDEKCRSQLDS